MGAFTNPAVESEFTVAAAIAAEQKSVSPKTVQGNLLHNNRRKVKHEKDPYIRVQNARNITANQAFMNKLEAMKADFLIVAKIDDTLQFIPFSEEGAIAVVHVNDRCLGLKSVANKMGMVRGARARAEWKEGAFVVNLKDLT